MILRFKDKFPLFDESVFIAENAAVIGVYLHGLAGDIAAEKDSPDSIIASDIIENIGNAFKQLKGSF